MGFEFIDEKKEGKGKKLVRYYEEDCYHEDAWTSIEVDYCTIYGEPKMVCKDILRCEYPEGKLLICSDETSCSEYKVIVEVPLIFGIEYAQKVIENGIVEDDKRKIVLFNLIHPQVVMVYPSGDLAIPDVVSYRMNGRINESIIPIHENLNELKGSIYGLCSAYDSQISKEDGEVYVYYYRYHGNDNRVLQCEFEICIRFIGTAFEREIGDKIALNLKNVKCEVGDALCVIRLTDLIKYIELEEHDISKYEEVLTKVITYEDKYYINNKYLLDDVGNNNSKDIELCSKVECINNDDYIVNDELNDIYNEIYMYKCNGLNPIQNDLDYSLSLAERLLDKFVDDVGMRVIKDIISYENKIMDFLSKPGSSNIILYGNELYRCDEFVNRFARIFGINKVSSYSFVDFETDRISKKHKIIYIKDCPEKPYVDSQAGTGTVEEEQKEAEKEFLKKWKDIKKLIDECQDSIFIISMKDYVYKDYYLDERVISSVYFAKHINIHNISSVELADAIVKNLSKYELKVKKDFYCSLKEYIEADYESGDVVGNNYINYLTKIIFEEYTKKDDYCSSKYVTSGCIPQIYSPTVDEIFEEFDKTVYGQSSVREQLVRICNQSLYKTNNKNVESANFNHMLFIGGPGTGKTKIARLTAKILYAAGITKKKKMVEISGNDLESKWSTGHTEFIKSKIREAYGGVLFIDEAYSIAEMSMSAYGDKSKEIINILIKEMWDNKDKLVVILAGYEEKMDELFAINEGLKNRIAYTLKFDNYSSEDLTKLLDIELDKRGFKIKDEITKDELRKLVKANMYDDNFGSVRGIKRLAQEIVSECYKTINDIDEFRSMEIYMIEPKHIKALMPKEFNTCISSLIGLTRVKQRLEELKNRAIYEKKARANGINLPKSSMHMVFLGNPGTGKTTVAKCLAQELYNLDVLLTNKMVVINPGDLVSTGLKNYKELLNEKITKAKGGVLFIDEAYSLTNKGSYYGQEVIEELLIAMEERKEDTIFIFAGYIDEMHQFIDSNPGIKSRISREIIFDDYSVEELMDIFNATVIDNGYICSDEASNKVKILIKNLFNRKNLGNGRFIDKLFSIIIDKKSMILSQKTQIDKEDITSIFEDDVPSVDEILDIIPDLGVSNKTIGFI